MPINAKQPVFSPTRSGLIQIFSIFIVRFPTFLDLFQLDPGDKIWECFKTLKIREKLPSLVRLRKREQEYAPVRGCAWNSKLFSWAMKENPAIILISHSILTCPSNSWPLGVLSVFKLVSRKTGASQPPGSWIWGPQGLRSLKCSKLLFR